MLSWCSDLIIILIIIRCVLVQYFVARESLFCVFSVVCELVRWRHAVQWIQCCRRIQTVARVRPHRQLDSAMEGKHSVRFTVQSQLYCCQSFQVRLPVWHQSHRYMYVCNRAFLNFTYFRAALQLVICYSANLFQFCMSVGKSDWHLLMSYFTQLGEIIS